LTLADLVTDLRIDLSDPDAVLFVDATLERCVRKAIFRVARDLKQSIGIVAGEIVPEVDGETREIILIIAQVHACQVMRSATANAFSFASGDKRVDKTKQPEHWAKLEADLMSDYTKRLRTIFPDAQVNEESYIITPSGLSPVIYEQGKCLEDGDDCC